MWLLPVSLLNCPLRPCGPNLVHRFGSTSDHMRVMLCSAFLICENSTGLSGQIVPNPVIEAVGYVPHFIG